MYIAGVDEAGRGPLAGPVVAAAVILDPKQPIDGLRDSKKLTAKKRSILYEVIGQKALAVNIAMASVIEIDQINILQATLLAMRRAVLGLSIKPGKVLVDGNHCPRQLPYITKAIVKGDDIEPAISAASIIAKVTRDNLMLELATEYPQYGFAAHKGYGTLQHREAIKRYGKIKGQHRESFTVK